MVYLQREGIDCEEVFAPVVRIKIIRLVVGIANNHNWPIYQMDVKSAFLNGLLEEEVFVGYPHGFVVKDQELKFYKLKKALYGLKQAPKAWNKKIDGFLKDVGFKKCVSEHGVYVKTDTNDGVIILFLYVDDLLITRSNKKCISKFKSEFMEKFEMTDLGLMTYFLGIEFHKSNRGLLMHQRRYALEILNFFEIEHCNAAIYLVEPILQLSKNKNEVDSILVLLVQYATKLGV